jgi:hypothetical protein
MAVKNTDVYANIAYLNVVESAANTLTWARLDIAQMGFLQEKKFGMLIKKVAWVPSYATEQLLVAANDSFNMAITTSDAITVLSQYYAEVVLMRSKRIAWYGAPANAIPYDVPYYDDLTSIGGLLVPADRIYLGIQGVSLASACTIQARVYYSMVELAVDQYWELVESRHMIST